MLAVMTMTLAVGVLSIGQASAAHGTIDRAAYGVNINGEVDVEPTPNCALSLAFGECAKEAAGFNREGVAVDLLQVGTIGTHDPLRADSEVTLTGTTVAPGGTEVFFANVIKSTCAAAENELLQGGTVLADADFFGQEPPAPFDAAEPPPNTVAVDTPLLKVVLNEQIVTDEAGNRVAIDDPSAVQIVVNAVHITTFDPLTGAVVQDIILAHTQCSVHLDDAGAGPGDGDADGFGYLEICKRADNSAGQVTGKFRFRFAGRSVVVPVGTCSGPIRVPAGRLAVREVRKDGVRMSGCSTRPVARLLLCDPAERRAVVRIVRGGIARETVLNITNRRIVVGDNKGGIKVCKIAGSGVKVGTTFRFTVGGRQVSVPAGPASQGGYCKIVGGFDRGSAVKVTEAARSGIHVSRITVRPVDRKISANRAQRTATVRIGKGYTVVAFTNARN